MIYKVIASVIIDMLFKRPGERKLRKLNKKFLAGLEKEGSHDVAEAFRHADGLIDACSPEEICIDSFDGTKLYGRYFEADPKSDLTFILLHGYYGSGPKNFILQFDMLRATGANILMVDQRAHGKSEGKFITFGVKERCDVAEWVKLLLSRNEKTKFILYGVSMGASTVLAAAALPVVKDSLCGIIADCGFTSPADEFKHLAVIHGKSAPQKFIDEASKVVKQKADFETNEFTTLDSVSAMTVPALFVHGKKDKFVPSDFTVRNYEACTSPYKRLLLVDNAYHAGSFYHDTERYTAEIRELINEATKTLSAAAPAGTPLGQGS